MIKRVRLRNFKVHIDFNREFKDFTVILGRNNAGKSTILEAISKTLYADNESFGINYVRRGVREGFIINLELEDGWKVELSYPPKTIRVYRDSKYVPDGLKALRRALGLPEKKNEFDFLGYIKQGSLDEFNQNKFDEVKKHLGINFPDKVIKCAERIEGDLEKKMKEILGDLGYPKKIERNLKNKKNDDGITLLARDLKSLRVRDHTLSCEIRRIERIRKNIEKTLNEIREEKDKVQKELEDLRRIREKRIELSARKEHLEERKRRIVKEMEELESRFLKELPVDVSYLKRLRDFLKYWNEMKDTEEDAKNYESLRNEYERIKSEKNEKKSELNNTLQNLRNVYNMFNNAHKYLKDISNENLKSDVQDIERKIDELEKEKERIIGERGHYKKRRESLLGSGDVCPVCGEPLPPEKRENLINETERMLEILKEKERMLNEKISSLKKEKENLSMLYNYLSQISEYSENFQHIPLESWLSRFIENPANVLDEITTLGLRLKSDLEKIENESKEIEKRYSESLKILEESYTRYNYAKKQLERIPEKDEMLGFINYKVEDVDGQIMVCEEYYRKKKELEEIEKEIAKIESMLKEIKDVDKDIETLKKTLENYTEKEEKLYNDLQSLQRQKDELSKVYYEVKSKYEKLRNGYERYHWADLKMKNIEKFISDVERARQKFVSILKSEFERILHEYFIDMFGFSNRYEKIEVDENFEPVFYTLEGVKIERGQELSVNKAGLSGGERTALGLAYKLALRRCIGKPLKLIMLDEPTTHLDAERRESVWKILSKLQKEEKLQIIVVTHDELVEDVISKENIIRI